MKSRSYGQFCPLARALDAIGERWTLLIVRELIVGPRRFSDLMSGLPGLGTGLLTRRLRHLEDLGLIRRSFLPAPAASSVYELAEGGRELAEALEPLIVWGGRFMGSLGEDRTIRPDLLVALLPAIMEPGSDPPDDVTWEFRVDDGVFHVRCEAGQLHGELAPAPGAADLVVRTDIETFARLGFGLIEPGEALASGRLDVDGDPGALAALVKMLPAGRA